ncbi:MAG: CoA ester lyase [Pseudomonadota bacterium]
MKWLRTFMYVPGIQERMLAKAHTSGADALVLDLEDSVPFAEKNKAREMVSRAAKDLNQKTSSSLFVRINGTQTEQCVDDIMGMDFSGLMGISVPKVESPGQLAMVDGLLTGVERKQGLEAGTLVVIVNIETAMGLVQSYEILKSSDRIVAVAFGGEDFALDLDLIRTEGAGELAYPRQMVAIAARAAGVQAIDMVYPNINDESGLTANTQAGRRMGYRSKQVIHPKQVPVVNKLLAPTDEELAQAQAIVHAFKEAERSGRGAVALDGKMVDRPVYERAERLLSLAKNMDM